MVCMYVCMYVWSIRSYTLSEAWSGGNWADLMAAQGAFGTDFYDRSTRTEYRLVIKIGPKGALGSHEIRPIHSAPNLGQSTGTYCMKRVTSKISNVILVKLQHKL